jgi:NitT/TauT family transport system permease protein
MAISLAAYESAAVGGASLSRGVAGYEAGLTRRRLVWIRQIAFGIVFLAAWEFSSGRLLHPLFS